MRACIVVMPSCVQVVHWSMYSSPSLPLPQRILVLLPEFIHRRWQFNSICKLHPPCSAAQYVCIIYIPVRCWAGHYHLWAVSASLKVICEAQQPNTTNVAYSILFSSFQSRILQAAFLSDDCIFSVMTWLVLKVILPRECSLVLLRVCVGCACMEEGSSVPPSSAWPPYSSWLSVPRPSVQVVSGSRPR